MSYRPFRSDPEGLVSELPGWKIFRFDEPGRLKGGIAVSSEAEPLVRQGNLLNLEGLMQEQGLESMRVVESRQTVRIQLGEDGFFLKKFLAAEGGMGPVGQALREFSNLLELSRLGFLCPSPVLLAWGTRDGRAFSAVMTKAIEGAVQADHLLGRINIPDLTNQRKLSSKERRLVLFEIGRVAGRLHRNGLIHRDLYLCHFFPVTAPNEDARSWPVYLIDLARLFRPENRFARWRLKDLASISYSARRYGLSRQELAVIWNGYFEASGLAPWSRPMWTLAASFKSWYIWIKDKERKAEARGKR